MKAPQLDNLVTSELFHRLALLLQSGIQVSDGLQILAEEENDKEYIRLLTQMASGLEEGKSLSAVFEEAGCFSWHIIGLIDTGEQVGRTEETFLSLSRYYANKERRNRKLKESFTYPCILLALMLIVIVVLLTKVLPIFNDVYASLGGSLTGAASALLAFGNALNGALPYLGIALGVIIMAVAVVLLLPELKATVTGAFRRVFGDSGVYRSMNNAGFAQALAVAVSCGIPFEEGVEMAGKMLSDIPKAQARCQKCVEMMENGTLMEDALRETGMLSKSVCYLLKLGIRAGKGDETMQQIAERMAQEAEDAIDTKLAKIEPALVIITSLITGAILLTVMLPLVDIMNAIG